MRVVAIDQGTTSTRLLKLDEGQRADITRVIRHRQNRPAPGRLEHSPEELYQNVKTLIDEIDEVDAIGLANQGESCLAWDAETLEALSPIIVWQDDRTSLTVQKMKADGLESLTLQRAGLPLDPYFSASKLSWLIYNNQAVANARKRGTLRLGTTDSFFINRLTGAFLTDATTASRTSLMNLEQCQWDAELCRLFDIPMGCLPEIRDSVANFGEIDGIPITASIVDQQASLFGHHCRVAGEAKITFGTGAFALVLTGDDVPQVSDSGLLPAVAWRIDGKTTYAIDGGVYDACSALDWAGQVGLFNNLSEIAHFSGESAISRGLTFVPALSGLAAPHWDRRAAALWIGMDAATDKSQLCRAVLEGVALLMAEVVSVIDDHVKIADTISIDGGLAQNGFFSQFLADVLQRRVVTHRFHELTALGCAYLAAQGAGSPVQRISTAEHTFLPRVPHATALDWRAKFGDAIARSKGWKK